MDIHHFGNPWEHLRLLSDQARNDALETLLIRRAPGARVLEIGCGTGLWSVLAAKLGAVHVTAVEPTVMAEFARELVNANDLGDRVTVIESTIEDLDPSPMDLVFSELLNADPFTERVVQVSRTAQKWLAPGGHLAPYSLRVYAALCSPPGTGEAEAALKQVESLAQRHGLDLDGLEGLLNVPPDAWLTANPSLVGPPSLVCELQLGQDDLPETLSAVVRVDETCEASGICVWFEASLDHDLVHHNRPHERSHWNQQVFVLTRHEPLGPDDAVHLDFSIDEDELILDELRVETDNHAKSV